MPAACRTPKMCRDSTGWKKVGCHVATARVFKIGRSAMLSQRRRRLGRLGIGPSFLMIFAGCGGPHARQEAAPTHDDEVKTKQSALTSKGLSFFLPVGVQN